jgi:hypothetical protein
MGLEGIVSKQGPAVSARSIQALDQGEEPNVTGNEPARGDVLMKPQACSRCDDCRWVCENHTDRPWLGEQACGSGGAWGRHVPSATLPTQPPCRRCQTASKLTR